MSYCYVRTSSLLFSSLRFLLILSIILFINEFYDCSVSKIILVNRPMMISFLLLSYSRLSTAIRRLSLFHFNWCTWRSISCRWSDASSWLANSASFWHSWPLMSLISSFLAPIETRDNNIWYNIFLNLLLNQ